MTRSILAAILLTLPLAAAHADLAHRPLAVLLVEQALGQEAVDSRVAATGAVHALRDTDGVASTQLAFDATGRMILVRLVRSSAASNATHGLTKATMTVAELFGVPTKPLEAAITSESIDILSNKSAGDRSRPLPAGATLSFLAAQDVLVLDLPVSIPPSRRLGPDAVEALALDASFAIQRIDETLLRYHAPDRRLAEGTEIGITTVTGAWKIQDNGAYCVEFAPIGGFTCHAVHQTDDKLHMVPLDDEGRPIASALAEFLRLPGNPGTHRIARRADSTPPRVTRMLTRDGRRSAACPTAASRVSIWRRTVPMPG